MQGQANGAAVNGNKLVAKSWLKPSVAAAIAEGEAKGQTFKGKLNIYVCETCRHHIVTRDLVSGTTPFMIDCQLERECKGPMKSSMYRVFDQTMRADFVWDRPPLTQILSPGELEHVERGGLLLREPTEQERETV